MKTESNTDASRQQHALSELIERLEKASGPDRELDYEIVVALTRLRPRRKYGAAEYTLTVDAAFTLLPRQCEFHFTRGSPGTDKEYIFEFREQSELGWVAGPPLYRGVHDLAPHAICIAALKARAASPQGDDQ